MAQSPAPPPPILSRALVLLFVSSFGAIVNFYLLLSVVPLYATSLGAGRIGAGLATGAMMFATVAAELVTPRLVGRFGYRLVFAAGLAMLGLPALALPVSASMAAIVAGNIVRGFGLAVTVVAGMALVVVLVPRERRGEALGLYGVVAGVPAVVALPLGVWLAGHVGYPPVFIAAAVSALAGLALVPGLPGRETTPRRMVGLLAGLRAPALVRPSLLFSVTAVAAGVVVTFLPLAVTRSAGTLAAAALLVQASATTLTRWWTGLRADRHGSAGLLIPSVAVAAVGVLAIALVDSPMAVLGGMLLLGAGFGVAQNASLVLMFERVSQEGYDTVSALWNLAYDAGMGLGASAFGVLAARTGYPLAFAVTAAAMLAALAPTWRDRAWLAADESEAARVNRRAAAPVEVDSAES
ncbi:MAG TPA: MFS transporter [Gemmatimonadaceae bacterium]